jgi:RHS repeat-associated protein
MIDVADGNAVYHYHYDGLGSVVALTDSAGNAVQLYEYSAFGRVAASDPNHTNPFLFTGRRFDAEAGLYYYRARYYNPHIGRFLQTDPIGYDDDINWYRYCENSPVNLTDPYGLWSIWGIIAGDWSWEPTAAQRAELRAGFVEGAKKGAAATADGAIPFADPFVEHYADASGNVPTVYKWSRLAGNVVRDASLGAVGAAVWGYVGATEVPGYAGMNLGKQFLVNRAMSGTFMANAIQFELGATVATVYSVSQTAWTGVQAYEYAHAIQEIVSDYSLPPEPASRPKFASPPDWSLPQRPLLGDLSIRGQGDIK